MKRVPLQDRPNLTPAEAAALFGHDSISGAPPSTLGTCAAIGMARARIGTCCGSPAWPTWNHSNGPSTRRRSG